MSDEGKWEVWRTALSLENHYALLVPLIQTDFRAEWFKVSITHGGCQSGSCHITIPF